MSGAVAQPRRLSTPVPGRPFSGAATRAPIELYTPATLGWVAFLCGLPAGFVLAALNYQRMGDDNKAGAHFAGAAGVLALLLSSPRLGPLGGLLDLALLVGGIVYLVRDAWPAAAAYRTDHPAYDAHGFQGFLIGLGVAVASVVVYLVFASPLLG